MNTNVVPLADHKARKRNLQACTNTECGKLMRPKDTLKTDFPGTVAGLERFPSRRFARGIKPENIRYFDGRPLGRSTA